jgi:hypothetical protein
VSLLPSSALGYQEVVAEYFLGLRGAGLMISPLDAELVARWEARGIPVAVVCRGLRRGLEEAARRKAPGGSLPRSIRALRLAVEDEWRAYRSGRVGDSPAPPAEAAAAHSRLEAARALLARAGAEADGSRREGYRDAWRALTTPGAGGTPLERVEAALASADDRILAAWRSGLPRAERAALGPRIALLTGARPHGASRRAYREALRTHLFDLAREAGLTCLRGSV